MDTRLCSEAELWKISELRLEGYSSIIAMLCRADNPGPDGSQLWSSFVTCRANEQTPRSALIIDVSRRLVSVVDRLLATFPVLPMVSIAFGLHRCYVPFGYLACHVLENTDDPRSVSDALLFKSLADRTADVARGQADIRPLVQALQTVSSLLCRRVQKPMSEPSGRLM